MDDFWFQLVDLQFVLSILTVIYYSYLLSIMLTSEKNVFHSAFFKIFIVTGFFDIMCVFAIEWVRADLKIGFGPRFEVISRIASVMTATNFFTHIIGCLLMTLNRYMAACHPRIYSVVWSPKVLGLLLILDVVISYASYTPLFPVKFVYEWRNDTWKLIGRERPVPEVRITLAVGATIYEIVSVLLIAKTAYALRKAVRDQRTRKSNQDLGLVMVTVLDCVLGVLECIYEISAIFPVDSVNSPVIYWINRNYNFYLFLLITMNAYSILLLSSAMRKEAFRFCRSHDEAASSIISPNHRELTNISQRKISPWSTRVRDSAF